MPYTTWGYMTHEDIREVEEDMDLGSITIQIDDPPEWFERSNHQQKQCPVCDKRVWSHDSVVVTRASGEIVLCVDMDGAVRELPETEDEWI